MPRILPENFVQNPSLILHKIFLHLQSGNMEDGLKGFPSGLAGTFCTKAIGDREA